MTKKIKTELVQKCGAKTRAGTPCANGKMKNGRCRMHGGKSTGPKNPAKMKKNTNAVKHSIYRKYLTDEEKEEHDDLKLGTVENELRLARIRVKRILAAEKDGVECVADYDQILDKALGRVESLEKTRSSLIEAQGGELPPLVDPDADI